MALPDYAALPDLSRAREYLDRRLQLPGPVPASATTAAPQVEVKASNPKDAIGKSKLSIGWVPDSLVSYAAVAFSEGATKYGAYNWRVAGASAQVYHDALRRHLSKWFNGEDSDAVTDVPHLASVIACAAIILDSELAGTLVDDRPPKVDLSDLIRKHEAIVGGLKELHKDIQPVHNFAKNPNA